MLPKRKRQRKDTPVTRSIYFDHIEEGLKKNSKGNLLVTFIMVVAFSLIVFSFIFLIGIRLKESGIRVSEVESFYVAEAGLNKAIWYLATPVSSGGKGFSWRATGSSESFGWGRYYMTVHDTAVTEEVLIISTGQVGGIIKTVSQIVDISGLPPAFDYAVFSNGALGLSGAADVIHGDIFVDGNTTFSGNASVSDGYVYHPAGTSITGSGTWTDGGEPVPAPSFPVLDSSYYDNLISAAGGVSAGNQTYSNATVNLSGNTVYVHGNVDVSGTTTFNGPGTIVATGTINFSGNTYTSNSVKFISNGALSITGNAYTSSSTYYSNTSLSASGNTRVNTGGFITKGTTNISGNITMTGILYSMGQINLSGNPSIRGAMVSGSVSGLSGSTSIYFDETMFPAQLPPGFPPSSLSRVMGTWKGN